MKSRGWYKCTNRRYCRLWEYRTPAVYHAASTILAGINAIQKRFQRECLKEEDALVFFQPGPAETRRDIAMLGLIHRTVLGWSETLCEHCSNSRHHWPLRNTVGTSSLTEPPEIFRNWSFPHWVSLMSAIWLPSRVVEQKSVACNATRIAMPPEIQSSEQGGRLAAHLCHSASL